MKKNNNQHGGGGRKQGRKPVEDKKVTLAIYPRLSRIDALGVDEAKEIALKAVESAYNRKLKKS